MCSEDSVIGRRKKGGHFKADRGLRTSFLLGDIRKYLWVPGESASRNGDIEVTRKKRDSEAR